MTQEVEIKVSGEFDANLDKSQITNLVQTVLNQSPYKREQILKVTGVKEEAEIYKTNEPEFPNGFESWHETHFEVVEAIVIQIEKRGYTMQLQELQEQSGRGAIWEYAKQLTNEFEKKNEGREWDGEFYDEIDEFLTEKLGS